MFVVTIKDEDAVIEQTRAGRIHLAHDEDRLDPGAAAGKRRDQIRLTVVVPERARIDPALSSFYQERPGPFTREIIRLSHVDPKVGIGIENVELALMKSDRRRPDTASVLNLRKNVFRMLFL